MQTRYKTLYITKFPAELHAEIKSKAAKKEKTLRNFVIEIFRDGLKYRDCPTPIPQINDKSVIKNAKT